MLWRFYMNITSCIDLIGYWSETIFIISLKENIVFVKFFGTSFGRNIIASFTQSTDTIGFIQGKTFDIHIQGNFLHK